MSNRPSGRRPRHVRDITNRFSSDHGGYVLWIETTLPDGSGPRPERQVEDWFPGTIREAIVRARTVYPGCRIVSVEGMEWHDWIMYWEWRNDGP